MNDLAFTDTRNVTMIGAAYTEKDQGFNNTQTASAIATYVTL